MATLPIAWLAPPDNLLPSKNGTNIPPAPIAISATIALIVGTAVVVLFSRKNKDVFLEDRIPDTAETSSPTAIADNIKNNNNGYPPIDNRPLIQRPPSIHAKTIMRQPSFESQPKLDAVLGFKDNWDFEHIVQTPRLPIIRHTTPRSPPVTQPLYFPPSRVDDVSDVDTLMDDEKNSAYVPYPRSEASDDPRGYGRSGLGMAENLQVLDDDSVLRRSPLSLDSRTNLGDAY
ncbi:hypothetical protein IQ06DRAFT_73474 [Phaeosphaeriaceae sp. SRC1lsM3a]|nr:hypothetical protein IQ06DRAFT_73474 [Stagonospora sp. SRC1lsM3a]